MLGWPVQSVETPLHWLGCGPTAPWGPVAQPPFLNMAALIRTTLPPHALLDCCLAIEAEHGRVRRERFGPRTLDQYHENAAAFLRRLESLFPGGSFELATALYESLDDHQAREGRRAHQPGEAGIGGEERQQAFAGRQADQEGREPGSGEEGRSQVGQDLIAESASGSE